MRALTCLVGRHVWYGFLAIILALLMVACGGGRHNQQAALPLAGNAAAITTPETPQTPATLAEALAQLDALAMPEGVAPEVWDELKGKLRAGLSDRFGGKGTAKIAAKAPTGAENTIKWIYALKKDALTPGRLAWRYQNAGDYNLDGIVSAGDVTALAVAFGKSVSDFPEYERIDTSGNGKVDIADLTSIVSHFGNAVGNYKVYMRSMEGQWAEVASIPFIASEVAGGWRTYDLACDSWETPDTSRYMVCPFSPDGEIGAVSLHAREWYSDIDLCKRLAGVSFDIVGQPTTEPRAFSRWEFPPEVRMGPALGDTFSLNVTEPGEYGFFRLISYDGEVTYRIDFRVTVVAPNEIPIDCRSFPTPDGPMLYWSREGYTGIPDVTLTVLRDGQRLAEIPGSNWYYLDDNCGLEEHAYQLFAEYRGFQVTKSERFLAGGAVTKGEHLYLLMEPANYADVSGEILGLVVNTKHPMWMVPSIKVGTYGVATASLAPRFVFPDRATTKSVSELVTPYRMQHMLAADFAFEYSFWLPSNRSFDWEERGESEPETIPPGSTVMLGPVGSSISRSDIPGARIAPTTNDVGHSLFYIDAYRNMYRFEYIHNFRLDNYAIGPGIPTEPFSGVMPVGKPPLYGDLNDDGRVDTADVTAIAMNWNSETNENNYHADQNYDGYITFVDILYMLLYFGNTQQ